MFDCVRPRVLWPCSLVLLWFIAALAVGCVDLPHDIEAPRTMRSSARLSDLGVFAGDPSAQQPADGFVAYDVNVSLYADGAQKHRFVFVPPGTTIHAVAGRWEIPTGTIFVKTFYYPNDARDPTRGEHLIETRFLVRTATGYDVATYVWNNDQTDAIASGGNLEVPVSFVDSDGAAQNRSFHVPGTSQCQSCHGDRALGWRTRQIDRAQNFADGTSNQIDHLIAMGVLDGHPPATDALVDPFGAAPLDTRARSYLDANCGHCHSSEPTSSAAGTHVYWDYDATDASLLPLCRATYAINGRNRVIVPGDPDSSEILARMRASDPFARMPLGPSRIPDGVGMEVLAEWITSMSPRGCP